MAATLTYSTNFKVVETLEANVQAASSTNKKITHDQFNTSVTLNAESTPVITKTVNYEVTLSGGAATIDLTALKAAGQAAAGTIDGTGLKIQAIRLKNKSTNANAMTFSEGASNGYALFGASWLVTLPVGGEVVAYLPEGTPDVATGDKTIDIAGTGSQVAQIQICLG